jgi:glucose-1-phosphate cytidylyltransferase
VKAVILAGGLGTRLSEETDRVPKPMVEIGGRPILWHIMKIYSHFGVNDFVICLGYRGQVIKDYFANYAMRMSDVTYDLGSGRVEVHENSSEPWRVTLVDTGEHTQTGGRLRRVRHYVGNETFCFTYGDGVSDVDIAASIKFHNDCGKLATVTAVPPPGRYGLLRLSDAKVTSFAEKVDMRGAYINGGFFVLEPGAIDYVDGDGTPWESAPLERLAAGGELTAYRHSGFWKAMDTLRDRRELEQLWVERKAPWKIWS